MKDLPAHATVAWPITERVYQAELDVYGLQPPQASNEVIILNAEAPTIESEEIELKPLTSIPKTPSLLQIPLSNENEANEETVAPASIVAPNDQIP